MIVLDTNVVSVAMGTAVDASVTDWLSRQNARSLFITAITRAEIRYGVARLPKGKRRDGITQLAERFLSGQRHRTLPFDADAADAYGTLVAERERNGRPISVADAQIASIARVHGARVATRDISGFDFTGTTLVNPFWRRHGIDRHTD